MSAVWLMSTSPSTVKTGRPIKARSLAEALDLIITTIPGNVIREKGIEILRDYLRSQIEGELVKCESETEVRRLEELWKRLNQE